VTLTVLDCRTCGACCTTVGSPPFSWEEKMTMPTRLAAAMENRVRSRGQPCHAFDAARVRCRIYKRRPRRCRDFEVGGGHCREFRRGVGIE
jgi:Fe-S-cluster containining protein